MNIKIAVAGTGYVGLSIATLLSQHHEVMAVDIIPEKVELINPKNLQFRIIYWKVFVREEIASNGNIRCKISV